MRRFLPVLIVLVLLLAACGAGNVPDPAVTIEDATEIVPGLTDADAGGSTNLEATAGALTDEIVGEATMAAIPTPTEDSTIGAPTAEATQGAQARKQYTSPPPMQIDPNKNYTATIQTNRGTIVAELYPKDAPKTVNNFVFLAREGFYDGVPFHRIISGFMVQTGDPTGTGTGGPGYQFPDEPVKRPYSVGTLAMANAGPDTNGSQFFIVQGPNAAGLPPDYTIFGKVIKGQEVVDAIASTPVVPDERGEPSKPTEPVNIESISIQES